MLLIFDSKAPYISNKDIADLWGYGMTDTHKVYDADTLALYFRAYLSDIEYVEETNSIESADICFDYLSENENLKRVFLKMILQIRRIYHTHKIPLYQKEYLYITLTIWEAQGR